MLPGRIPVIILRLCMADITVYGISYNLSFWFGQIMYLNAFEGTIRFSLICSIKYKAIVKFRISSIHTGLGYFLSFEKVRATF